MATQPPGLSAPPMTPPAGLSPAPPGMPAMAGPPKMPPLAGAPAAPGTPGAPPPPQEENGGMPQLGFFQQPWVQTALPLITSLVAHAAIVVLATIFAVVVVIDGKKIVTEEQVTIPESTATEDAQQGGVPNVGTHDDPLTKMTQDQSAENATPDGNSNKAGPSVDPSSEGGGSGDAAPSDLLRAGGPGGGRGAGFSSGTGNGDGSGEGKGGPLAQFGPPGGGGIGPKGVVFGNGGNARKIVFLCDATGTMISKLSSLKAALQDTVQNLKPFQAFNIVFYTDGGKVLMADKTGLMVANTENKRKAFEWLGEVTASGTTDPIPAIEATFKLTPVPDLVYFLSDGEFNNLRSYEEVAAAIGKGSSAKRVKVNTILFDTYDKEAEKVMEKIAYDAKGVYKYRREQDIQQ
jgi:hypothetical protein